LAHFAKTACTHAIRRRRARQLDEKIDRRGKSRRSDAQHRWSGLRRDAAKAVVVWGLNLWKWRTVS
jgi:hypothetical protein